MLDGAIVLSIQPKFYNLILSGEKTVELRKQLPKRLKKGVIVLLYVTSPVKALAGGFIVDDFKKLPLDNLWNIVEKRLGMSRDEFNRYYSGSSEGVAIFFNKLWLLQRPFELSELRECLDVFIAPQNFRYLTAHESRYLIRAVKTEQISNGKKLDTK